MSELENIARKERTIKKIVKFGGRYIDYKIGLLGAAAMGSIVFGINYHETDEALFSTTAAIKQSCYTFLFGGAVMKGCGYLATRIKNKALALTAAIIIPSTVTISLTYGLHNLKGTPEPVKSTVPTALLSFPGMAILGYTRRKQYSKYNRK